MRLPCGQVGDPFRARRGPAMIAPPMMLSRVPEPLERFALEMEDGARIDVRRHGVADAPLRIFLSHGNGFAIDGYMPFWLPLCARYEVVLFDMRNHGRSPPAAPEAHDYPHMARDVGAVHDRVTERLGPRRSLGAFHSMSGRAAMRDALDAGWRWDGLALFDPPDIPPEGHALHDGMVRFERRLAEWAEARPDRFADPSELAGQYAASRPHKGWADGAHALMAEAVLRPGGGGSGGRVLACPPALEAKMYLANIPMNLWPRASDFGGPVLLLGADPALDRPSPTAAANRALAEEGGFDYAAVEGAGHMLQIEKPAACLAALDAFIDRHRLAR